MSKDSEVSNVTKLNGGFKETATSQPQDQNQLTIGMLGDGNSPATPSNQNVIAKCHTPMTLNLINSPFLKSEEDLPPPLSLKFISLPFQLEDIYIGILSPLIKLPVSLSPLMIAETQKETMNKWFFSTKIVEMSPTQEFLDTPIMDKTTKTLSPKTDKKFSPATEMPEESEELSSLLMLTVFHPPETFSLSPLKTETS